MCPLSRISASMCDFAQPGVLRPREIPICHGRACLLDMWFPRVKPEGMREAMTATLAFMAESNFARDSIVLDALGRERRLRLPSSRERLYLSRKGMDWQ